MEGVGDPADPIGPVAGDFIDVGASFAIKEISITTAFDAISEKRASDGVVAIAAIDEEVGAKEGDGGEIKGVGFPIAEERYFGCAWGAIHSGGAIHNFLNPIAGQEGTHTDINGTDALCQDAVCSGGAAVSIDVKTIEAAPAPVLCS